jgi:hypothetical protein
MKIPFPSLRAFGALGATVALIACGDSANSITQPSPGAPSFHTVPIANPEVELLALCKVGPAGTYQFNATSTDNILFNTVSGTWDLSSATYNVTVGAGDMIDVGGNLVGGACFEFSTGTGNHNHIARASGAAMEDVTVVEVEASNPAGVTFVKVDKYQKTGGSGGAVVLTSSNVNTVTAQLGGTGSVANTLAGANVVFYNAGTPQTGAGCTPGFWKQEQHFQYWTAPYAPTTVISTVFTFPAGGYTTSKGVNVGNATLLQGLNFGGGSSTGDAAAILLRAGIAALLNAADSDVDYYLDVAGVISAVNAALASGDRTTMLTLASELDFENNRGCTAKD